MSSQPISPVRLFRALLLLPGVVIVIVPGLILSTTRSLNLGWSLAAPWNLLPILAGVALTGFGLHLMIQTITLFATVGQGTLAPWDAPQRLVVRGVYRQVRTP